jgi:hypothetical protein
MQASHPSIHPFMPELATYFLFDTKIHVMTYLLRGGLVLLQMFIVAKRKNTVRDASPV